jgi:hypothetical protein
VVTDSEQRKYHNFATYAVHGLPNTAPDSFKIPFSTVKHARQVRNERKIFLITTAAKSQDALLAERLALDAGNSSRRFLPCFERLQRAGDCRRRTLWIPRMIM